MYGMDKNNLQLMPHDVSWRDDFLAESRRIQSATADSSVTIEHIGSTSIPGIWAKPILDIAILCGKKDFTSMIEILQRLGYEYRGQFDDESGHFYAILEEDNIRLCQAHIYTEPNADWFSKLRFRDVLRENSEFACEYNDYKLALAKKVSNKSEYAEVKSKWVDGFILKIL